MINQNECSTKAIELRMNARETTDKDYQRMFEAMAVEWDKIGALVATHHALAALTRFAEEDMTHAARH